jgi:HD-GYP domain-containing protein (c-di-GMP phosphodiesterase class II)
LTTDRPYRPASDWKDARVEIRRFSGTQFDPTVVDAFDHISDEQFARLRGAL